MNAKYRVNTTEYERGWGRRDCDFELFDTLQEALDFQVKFNAENTDKIAPDWYMVAENPVLVDLDEEKK